MTRKQIVVEGLCDDALTRIDAAILNSAGEGAGTPVSLLKKVRREIVAMRSALDPKIFTPGYGRALLDWSNENGLIDFLIEVKYRYDRLP